MFRFNINKIIYQEPWQLTFDERLKMLVKGQKKVAYIYDNPDNSTFRYRVYNMIQALEHAEEPISAAYFTSAEQDKLNRIVDIADVIVVSRSKYTNQLNRIITKARNKGKVVFFDIDDLVFNPAYTHLIINTLDQDLNHPNVWDFWFAYIARQGATLKLCDRAITTNPYLAKKIQEYHDIPISIIPNFINKEQLDLSKKIYDVKKQNNFRRNDKIHLGYFSGTPSHNKDYKILSDTLIRLIEENPNIILRIVGYLDTASFSLEKYETQIEYFPLQNYLNLQQLIGEVEINLVPLQDNSFTNCKSELKYFEAGIVGTVSIASPIYTYRNIIHENQNGYLANSYEWYEKIQYLMNNLNSYPGIAEKAFKDSELHFAWYNQIKLIESTLFGN